MQIASLQSAVERHLIGKGMNEDVGLIHSVRIPSCWNVMFLDFLQGAALRRSLLPVAISWSCGSHWKSPGSWQLSVSCTHSMIWSRIDLIGAESQKSVQKARAGKAAKRQLQATTWQAVGFWDCLLFTCVNKLKQFAHLQVLNHSRFRRWHESS